MSRQRVSPFVPGTAERTLHDHYRKATARAEICEREAALQMTEARANRASAERYAEALRAFGHGDKVPGQIALPNYAKLGEPE